MGKGSASGAFAVTNFNPTVKDFDCGNIEKGKGNMKNYFKTHKVSLIVLAAALGLILLSSFFASMIQSAGYKVTVTDLRDEAYSAKVTNKEGDELTLKGTVASGILFVPKTASETNKLPAVALTHGYLNNRELQLQNAIELARRGFVVLTIDRGGHGNNEISSESDALTNTSGLYEAVQYLATLPYVDVAKIGVSGHSMGGMTTASVLLTDKYESSEKLTWVTNQYGMKTHNDGKMGLVSAGLMQGWSSFMGAGSDVSVGMLKAMDDEFFYTSKLPDGTPSISRQFLHSIAAASFVGVKGYGNTADAIDIKNGGIYVNGTVETVAGGAQASAPFRAIYEANEIHPLNHFSTESAGYVVNFFYTAFGTPTGYEYIAEGNQIWWVKELFSTLGLVGFFALVLPLADLLLTLPCFASLRKKQATEGEVGATELLPELKTPRKHVTYWVVAVIVTLFSGFSIQWVNSGWLSGLTDLLFTQNTYFPQDTTGWVATWAVVCGVFALVATGIAWLVNHIINRVKYGEEFASHDEHPLAVARIEGGFGAFVKTVLMGALMVALMYLVVFINWAIWKVDFRFWTFDVKVFEVATMLPTMLRYACVFFVFYAINSIFNQNYKVKNLPEWATIAINAVFNVLGIVLVMLIQYGTFRTTGVLWQSDMALGYIVLFPIVPVLVIATIFSRRLYARTGNAWLGAVVNTLLFTIITVANTAASYPYAGLFA
ncbi:MAG: S9 family peptidase [Corallococcus sp.]|nr:S9 family peptidase [Corallococcus sp.]